MRVNELAFGLNAFAGRGKGRGDAEKQIMMNFHDLNRAERVFIFCVYNPFSYADELSRALHSQEILPSQFPPLRSVLEEEINTYVCS